ncbi:uncharacterized protein BDR25DRAFT_361422 [Lindgomyces ingoldianus]|uniref:Uncharacterized protein n=1 Tax=Lindgomyces ingoldianus TaxID=673940 RepID=A0ACB6QCE2_9PLEO|nr:uncharacterized protein BDR25DRAFT_361422 [Lindgomyces ingoldianus]KAF2464581.1 hypothetical protein BDR25DRAFT_361422 [Lindgomyces ingoldianus]
MTGNKFKIETTSQRISTPPQHQARKTYPIQLVRRHFLQHAVLWTSFPSPVACNKADHLQFTNHKVASGPECRPPVSQGAMISIAKAVLHHLVWQSLSTRSLTTLRFRRRRVAASRSSRASPPHIQAAIFNPMVNLPTPFSINEILLTLMTKVHIHPVSLIVANETMSMVHIDVTPLRRSGEHEVTIAHEELHISLPVSIVEFQVRNTLIHHCILGAVKDVRHNALLIARDAGCWMPLGVGVENLLSLVSFDPVDEVSGSLRLLGNFFHVREYFTLNLIAKLMTATIYNVSNMMATSQQTRNAQVIVRLSIKFHSTMLTPQSYISHCGIHVLLSLYIVSSEAMNCEETFNSDFSYPNIDYQNPFADSLVLFSCTHQPPTSPTLTNPCFALARYFS